MMRKEQVIAILKSNEMHLRHLGILRAALFGSLARDEEHPGSDIDILIEVDPEAHITVFDYADLKEHIAGLFAEPVDVVDQDGLKLHVRPTAMADALYAF
jgi:predicted nucleotidyltransferase